MRNTEKQLHWRRYKLLAPLISVRGLCTRGFRKNLKRMTLEYLRHIGAPDTEFEFVFDEAFGSVKFVPAAHQIIFNEAALNDWPYDVHIYLVSDRMSDSFLGNLGWLADYEGPAWNLHIINGDGIETVIDNENLMCLSILCMPHGPDKKQSEIYRENLRKIILGGAQTSVPLATVYDLTPRTDAHKKWKAAYDAVKELGVDI